jgi:hypothetical protein
VTVRHVPDFDYPELDVSHDSAYWVTDVRTADDADSGLVDATSMADGYVEPNPETYSTNGTTPLAYTGRGVEWVPATEEPAGPENALRIDLSGVESATVWLDAAGLEPDEELALDVDSDAAATLSLRGGGRTRDLEVGPGHATLVVDPLTGSED